MFRSARLAADHDTTRFDCGVTALDEWIRTQALRAERAGVTATTVWTRPGDQQVLGFHSIAPTTVSREELPTKGIAAGFTTIPGYLLGRLALDRDLQGRKLGSQLLLDAIETIVVAAERGGGRVIVVDAIDDRAVSFYRHHDFIPIGDSRRLIMKIATARQAVNSR
ncbi:MAG: GNAT family N-acetyltransferase [Solirubrobacterales bacterium]|nr:GNAT family N-acetyltransferase [Solirubrobacterales bacterium]